MHRALCFLLPSILFAHSAFASVIWRGDFSTGNLSQWTSKEVAAADRVQVVSTPVPSGQGHAMQATVQYGDSVYGGARAELDYETDRPQEGSERYYRWQTYFPADFNSANYWQLFTQWHQYISGGSPPLAFMAWGEKIQLGNDQDVYFWNAPLVRGVWHDFVFHVVWSSNASLGRIELWYDGQHVLGPTATATLFAGDTVYLKQGLYRKSTIDYTQVVYHSGMVVGTTLADVMPSAAISATVSPNPVAFGSVRLGAPTTQKTVTVKNTGPTDLALSGYTVSGTGFSVSPASASATLAAGQSTNWTVTFNPTTAGAASGTITFNSGSSTLQTSLTGTAIFPKTSVSPTSVDFGGVQVGTTSAAQTITVSNTGTDTLTISGLALSGTNAGDFAFTPPASLTVAAGQSARISTTFHPSQGAAETATLSFTTDNGAQSVTLNGSGASAVASVAPTAVSFGTFRLGSAPTATVTVSNTGGSALTVSRYALGGTDAGAFTVSPASATTTIAAGSSATWTVTASPTSAGPIAASLAFTTNGGNVQAALSGTAIFPATTVSPTSLAFGRIRVGASTSQSFTVTNTGTDTLRISAISVSGTNTADFSSSAMAPLTFAVGSSLTVPVVFHPSLAGTETASLSLQTDNGTRTVSLSGTGVARALSSNPAQVSFGSQTVGRAARPLTVTITNGTTQAYRLVSCTFGGDNGSDFTVTTPPQTLAGGSSIELSIGFTALAMGPRTASLFVATDDPATTLEVPLDGVGISSIMSVAPVAVDFGALDVGGTASRNVTLSNTGTSPLQLQSASIVGTAASDFALETPPSVVTIAEGDSLTLAVRYAPTTGRTSLANLVITTDDPIQPVVTLPLSGEGLSRSIAVSATTVDFGSQRVGSPSDQQVLTLTNIGNAASTITVALAGSAARDFIVTGATEGHVQLAAGATVTLNLGFTPTSHGDRAATLTLTPEAPGSAVIIALTGTGLQPGLNASPTAIDFGSAVVGMPAMSETLTITNAGTAPLNLAAPALDSNAFTVDAPLRTVGVGQAAAITVTFNPEAAGTFHATLHLASTDSEALTADIQLSATAIAPGIALPSAVDFGTAKVHGEPVEKTIRLTNLDWATLTLTNVTVDSSAFAVLPATLPVTLEASGTTPLTLTFTPDLAGPITGKLSVFVAGKTDPVATVALSGVGEATAAPKRAGCQSTGASGLSVFGVLLALGWVARRRRAASRDPRILTSPDSPDSLRGSPA